MLDICLTPSAGYLKHRMHALRARAELSGALCRGEETARKVFC